jgi:hypothetical protein
MVRSEKMEDKPMSELATSKAIIWIARIWSLASIGFVLLFLFGSGLSGHGAKLTPAEWVGLAFFPSGVCLGLVIAWFRPRLGGAIATVCLIAFYLWSLWERGRLPGGPYFVLVAVPGFLFLLSTFVSWPRQKMRPA